MRVCQVNLDFDTPSSYSPPLCSPSRPSMAAPSVHPPRVHVAAVVGRLLARPLGTR